MHFEDGRGEELVAFVTGDACMQRRCCPSLALRRRRSLWMDVDMVGNQSSRYRVLGMQHWQKRENKIKKRQRSMELDKCTTQQTVFERLVICSDVAIRGLIARLREGEETIVGLR